MQSCSCKLTCEHSSRYQEPIDVKRERESERENKIRMNKPDEVEQHSLFSCTSGTASSSDSSISSASNSESEDEDESEASSLLACSIW